MTSLLVSLYFLLSFTSFAIVRQPAYYILGEEEFKGVQVYDVIQDNDWNYWFSTNEGLIFYDHYTFKKIECAESKSISFFNFVQSKTDAIFCNNLNNQIFKIEKNRCTLFYEVPTEEVHPDICLISTPENGLLIRCNNILHLDEDGNFIQRFSTTKSYIGAPYTTRLDEIIFPISNSDSVVVFANKKFYEANIKHPTAQYDTNRLLHFFSVDDQTYAIDLKSKLLFTFNEHDFTLKAIPPNELLKRSPSVRLYTTKNNVWAAGTLPGVAFFDKQLSNETAQLFYQNVFISDVYEDREGNILLCTFYHGVYVISNLNTADAFSEFKDDPVASIKSDAELGLIFGTTKGKLITYKDEKFKTIRAIGKRPVEVIITADNFPWVVFDDGAISAYNKRTGKTIDLLYASLKDGFVLNNTQFYLSTNIGFVQCTVEGSDEFSLKWIDELKFRNFASEHEEISNLIYTTTVNGLFVLDSTGKTKELLLNQESIFATTLHTAFGLVYAPLAKSSVLVIENGVVIDKIEPKANGKTVSIFKMIIYDGTIFAHTDLGLCQFDLSGNFIRSYNKSSGQSNERILDFEFVNNQLWVSKANGLQTIDLIDHDKPQLTPTIKIMHVFANDEEILTDSVYYFNSEIRKFQFIVSSPTLQHKSEINYHYKLEGYDTEWQVNDYFSNEILYNALAPGDYEFIVKAENQNQFSAPVSYKFSIAFPFYATWWFITLLITSFLIIVVLIYRRQLNTQRIKARQINELNASKLTAIQSQMNPHFIFNSLNSIQDLILKGDVEHSYSYITTFSNLVRRTLSYSDKDFIDFEQELKLLELYLSLEKLRFKKDFSFIINKNDISDIQIPPMLIQPFIENALVHGLLHKEGDKKLTISFTITQHLICVVEDNGIGREQAKAIKTRQRSEHESFSVQAIRKRFEILSEHYKGELGYHYTDLTENGEACGTRVTLQIPIKHKF